MTAVLQVNVALWLLVSVSAFGSELTFAQSDSLPPEVHHLFSSTGLGKKYVLSSRLNPFYVQGDFNGDSRLDTAVLIQSRVSNMSGIAIFHAGGNEVFILGAGTRIAGAGENETFDWMDAWYTYRKQEVKRGADENKPPVLRGDALYVEKTESASAIIYWDGSMYRWYQQGD
jgi:hypothetical protein